MKKNIGAISTTNVIKMLHLHTTVVHKLPDVDHEAK
jgi:hypothetical protein